MLVGDPLPFGLGRVVQIGLRQDHDGMGVGVDALDEGSLDPAGLHRPVEPEDHQDLVEVRRQHLLALPHGVGAAQCVPPLEYLGDLVVDGRDPVTDHRRPDPVGARPERLHVRGRGGDLHPAAILTHHTPRRAVGGGREFRPLVVPPEDVERTHDRTAGWRARP